MDDVLHIGNFEFVDIREELEDAYGESDEYRGFEVWNGRNWALLEDQGALIKGDELVEAVLKVIDTGKGSLAAVTEESRNGWELKQALDKAGEGLLTWGFTDCDFLPDIRPRFALGESLSGCRAAVWTVKGGDPNATEMDLVFVFSSERRAESGMDDIEEAILDSDADIDIDLIEADGEFVNIVLTLHHDE